MPFPRIGEANKVRTRRVLQRMNLGITRDPAMSRLVRALAALRVNTVLDVGANEGQFADLLRAAGFPGRIVSFEPTPSAFALLERRAAKDPNWSARQCAMGNSVGQIEINVSKNSYSSSILPMTAAHLDAAPESRYVAREQVAITTLENIVDEMHLKPPSTMLKIDTQGYEASVLDGAKSVLDSIAAVQLELSLVPLYEGQELSGRLSSRLESRGLSLHSFDAGIADKQGQLLQFDGLFVRRELLLENGD